MPTYTNPTGNVTATSGDDSIIVNTPWTEATTVDAADGHDTLLVQFEDTGPVSYYVSDSSNTGFLNAYIQRGPQASFVSLTVNHVEDVTLHGTSNNDIFSLYIGPNTASSGLAVSLDGAAGQDTLSFNWSQLTTGLSFQVNGSTITSDFGSFTNFETFGIRAGSGNDTITTGDGDDFIATGAGVDTVNAGAGNDGIEITANGGTIDGGAGDDYFVIYDLTTAFAGSIIGGDGQDKLTLQATTMTSDMSFVVNGSNITSNIGTFSGFEQFEFHLGSGNDTVTGGNGDDYLIGGDGNDTLSAGDGNDTVNGQAGDDTLNGGAGNDSLGGENGNDTIDGGDGNDNIYGDSFPSFPGDGNDHLSGGAGHDSIYGGGGDDTIDGGADDDSLYGGAGSDHLDGGEGNDWLSGDGEYGYSAGDNFADVLIGGVGDDTLDAGYGDSVDGGTGTDSLQFNGYTAPAGISADFSQLAGGGTIIVGGATLTGIEYVTGISGTPFDDNIIAGAVPGIDGITLDGWGGNDNLTGSSGTDMIYGGDGDDIIHGGVGLNPAISPSTDRLMGENGNDTIYSGPDGALVSGGNGDDTIYGADAYDELNGDNGNDVMYGGAGNDGLQGWDGSDYLDGGAGADAMDGGDGDDTYVVDNVGDVVWEYDPDGTGTRGNDTVLSSVSFALPGMIENLTLTGSEAINGTGNSLNNILTGNGADNILVGGAGNDTLKGGAGSDTASYVGFAPVTVSLAIVGPQDTGGAGIDTLSSIENVIGSWSSDTLTGNAFSNIIDGSGSTDTMIGGAGSDTYIVDMTGDVVIESAGEGTDTVRASASYSLSANVENLVLTNGGDINGTGNALDNRLTGNDGNNVLNGGAGADTMAGGLGDDTFIVDNVGDIITEFTGEGTDLVLSSVTYTLRSGLENMTLTGAAAIDGTGNAVANFIRGNGAANTLDGGNGNDTLYGNAGDDTLTGGSGNDLLQGNTGNDHMTGGVGNDTYYVDALGDTVSENAGEGTDIVIASIDYTLGANLENLTLQGTAINAIGNAANNLIHGNNSDNWIDGGSGADQMYGLGGDDHYVVDNAGDRVFETVTGGTDTVLASVTFKLGSGVENLTMTGIASIDATGNSLANEIIGNNGSNELIGETGNDSLTGQGGNDILNGGEGADAMSGGTGNDTYYVDNVGDVVAESAGEGTDVVKASISWTLGLYTENMTLGGSSAINGTGNELNNSIHGNAGANVLNGADGDDALNGGAGADTLIGGVGRDTMTGGADNDLFKFADGDFGGVTRASADRIVDFASGDKIDLSAVDADTGLASDQSFSFLGTGAFTNTAGELRFEQVAGNTYLSGDTDGDGIADFMIKLDGLHTVQAGDLVL